MTKKKAKTLSRKRKKYKRKGWAVLHDGEYINGEIYTMRRTAELRSCGNKCPVVHVEVREL